MRHFSFLLDLFLTKNIDVRGPDQSRTLSQPPFYVPSKLVVNHTMESKPFRGSQTTLTRRGSPKMSKFVNFYNVEDVNVGG